MKKTKISAILLFALLVVTLLSSCTVNMKTAVSIDGNDGGKIIATVEMEKSTYDYIMSLDNEEISRLEQDGVKKETFKKDDVEYVKLTEKENYNTYSELCNALKQKHDFTSFSIKKNDEQKRITVAGAAKTSNISYYESYIIEIEMPGKILEFKGATLGNDKDTFVLDLKEIGTDEAVVFSVVSEFSSFNSSTLLVILALVGLVGAIVIIVFIIKKKLVY